MEVCDTNILGQWNPYNSDIAQQSFLLDRLCLQRKTRKLAPLIEQLEWNHYNKCDAFFKSTWDYYASGCKKRLRDVRNRIDQNANFMNYIKDEKAASFFQLLTCTKRKRKTQLQARNVNFKSTMAHIASSSGSSMSDKVVGRMSSKDAENKVHKEFVQCFVQKANCTDMKISRQLRRSNQRSKRYTRDNLDAIKQEQTELENLLRTTTDSRKFVKLKRKLEYLRSICQRFDVDAMASKEQEHEFLFGRNFKPYEIQKLKRKLEVLKLRRERLQSAPTAYTLTKPKLRAMTCDQLDQFTDPNKIEQPEMPEKYHRKQYPFVSATQRYKKRHLVAMERKQQELEQLLKSTMDPYEKEKLKHRLNNLKRRRELYDVDAMDSKERELQLLLDDTSDPQEIVQLQRRLVNLRRRRERIDPISVPQPCTLGGLKAIKNKQHELELLLESATDPQEIQKLKKKLDRVTRQLTQRQKIGVSYSYQQGDLSDIKEKQRELKRLLELATDPQEIRDLTNRLEQQKQNELDVLKAKQRALQKQLKLSIDPQEIPDLENQLAQLTLDELDVLETNQYELENRIQRSTDPREISSLKNKLDRVKRQVSQHQKGAVPKTYKHQQRELERLLEHATDSIEILDIQNKLEGLTQNQLSDLEAKQREIKKAFKRATKPNEIKDIENKLERLALGELDILEAKQREFEILLRHSTDPKEVQNLKKKLKLLKNEHEQHQNEVDKLRAMKGQRSGLEIQLNRPFKAGRLATTLDRLGTIKRQPTYLEKDLNYIKYLEQQHELYLNKPTELQSNKQLVRESELVKPLMQTIPWVSVPEPQKQKEPTTRQGSNIDMKKTDSKSKVRKEVDDISLGQFSKKQSNKNLLTHSATDQFRKVAIKALWQLRNSRSQSQYKLEKTPEILSPYLSQSQIPELVEQKSVERPLTPLRSRPELRTPATELSERQSVLTQIIDLRDVLKNQESEITFRFRKPTKTDDSRIDDKSESLNSPPIARATAALRKFEKEMVTPSLKSDSEYKSVEAMVISDMIADFHRSHNIEGYFNNRYPGLWNRYIKSIKSSVNYDEIRAEIEQKAAALLDKHPAGRKRKKYLKKIQKKDEDGEKVDDNPCMICPSLERTPFMTYMQRMVRKRQKIELRAYYNQMMARSCVPQKCQATERQPAHPYAPSVPCDSEKWPAPHNSPECSKTITRDLLTNCYQALEICHQIVNKQLQQQKQHQQLQQNQLQQECL